MKLAIFDCDGVLVDSEVLLVDSEIEFLREHGLDYSTEDYIAQFMGIPIGDWLAKASKLLVEVKGEPLAADFFMPLEQLITKRIKEELQPVSGADEALGLLQMPKCVASSSSAGSLDSKLIDTGLVGHFKPHIFSTDLVKCGKPAPDLFLYAANQLNTLPADCVVVEDSCNGVIAGKRAGMRVIGFSGGSHCPPDHTDSLLAQGADEVATNYADIVRLLA